MLIPDSFFEVEFSKAMAFGYKTEEVDEYLSKAWEIIRAQQQELSTLQEKDKRDFEFQLQQVSDQYRRLCEEENGRRMSSAS